MVVFDDIGTVLDHTRHASCTGWIELNHYSRDRNDTGLDDSTGAGSESNGGIELTVATPKHQARISPE